MGAEKKAFSAINNESLTIISSRIIFLDSFSVFESILLDNSISHGYIRTIKTENSGAHTMKTRTMADKIRFNPSREQIESEWTGKPARTAAKPVETKEKVVFGKRKTA